MRLVNSNSGVARVIIVLVVIILLSGSAAAFMAFRPHGPSPASSPTVSTTSTPTASPSINPTPTSVHPSSQSPTAVPVSTPVPTNAPIPTTPATQAPTPSPTPTPLPTPTQSPSNTHRVAYTTMMTGNEIDYWNVSVSGSYTLTLNDTMTVTSGSQYLLISGLNSGSTIWSVTYLTSNTYQIGGNSTTFNCVNGIVYVIVNNNTITFIGTTSYTETVSSQTLTQVRTANGDGNFNSKELDMTLTTP